MEEFSRIAPGKAENLIGKKFGRLTVLYRTKNQGKTTMWLCQCECGNIKPIAAKHLKGGLVTSCGCYRKELSAEKLRKVAENREEDLTGKIFHYLKVLSPTDERDGSGRRYWLCQCKCGNTIKVIRQSLIQERTKSCGCYNSEMASKNFSKNIENQRFGHLTALKPTEERDSQGGVIWECKCDCGNTAKVSTHSLITGNTASCGRCGYHHSIISKNLVGKVFGKLTVIEKTNERNNNGEIIWKCQCECGSFSKVRTSALTSNSVQSCGCVNSRGEDKIATILKEANIPFYSQYTFENCRFPDTKAKARFDIYVNNYLIEFDGIQHYQTKNSGWDTEEHLEKTQEHDNYKNNWCKENNIPLIRIPYTKLDTLCIEDLLLESTQFRVV